MNDREDSIDDELGARVAEVFAEMKIMDPPSIDEAIQPPADRRRAVVEPAGSRRSGRSRGLRIAIGGIGLSAAAVLLLAIFNSQWPTSLSAMERMAKQLREVTSYQYRLSSVTSTTSDGGKKARTWTESGEVSWSSPDAFRFEDKITKVETSAGDAAPKEELLEHFVEVFPAGKPGMLIDHKRKTYFDDGFAAPIGSKTYPWQPLQMIREQRGEVLKELGTREIAGKKARGYATRFESGDPPRTRVWHVWVDPQTDLPLEISYQIDDHQQPRTKTLLRATDFQWNLPLDEKQFAVGIPADYHEKDPPQETK